MIEKCDYFSVLNVQLKTSTALIFTFFVAFSLVSLSGCSRNDFIRSSSSAPLAEVINNVKDSRQIIDKKAPLTLPTSVAIIFVPSTQSQSIPETTLHLAASNLKNQLLANSRFIKSVAIVSGDDLKSKISFDRIRALYAVDVVVLISYQQYQRTAQTGAAGLADLTILGAFLIPGVETITSTLVEGKLIHIANDAMIFKATGSDERSANSSSFSKESTQTDESIQGLLAATTDFGKSLSTTLENFKTYDASQAVSMSYVIGDDPSTTAKGKLTNDYWSKVDSYKSTRGGAFGPLAFILVIALCWVTRRLN